MLGTSPSMTLESGAAQKNTAAEIALRRRFLLDLLPKLFLQQVAPLLHRLGGELGARFGDRRELVLPFEGTRRIDDGARIVIDALAHARIERAAPGAADDVDI